jgi:aerobic carbon-monoxide dehydrogenase small subunit
MLEGRMDKRTIKFVLNGEQVELYITPKMNLLTVLREELGVTSVKRSCERGDCGACTVILDGKAVNSCLVLAASIEGKTVMTIEGLGLPSNLHPLQEAFASLGATQCGFCTSGMILSAKALLDENLDVSVEDVKRALSGNLCRCTGYAKPVQAVFSAAMAMRESVSVLSGAGVTRREKVSVGRAKRATGSQQEGGE